MRVSRSNRQRSTLFFSFSLGLSLLMGTFGCGPPSPRDEGSSGSSASGSSDFPDITEAVIHERINDARVRDIPSETGAAPPISWSFDEPEPKEIKVLEKEVNGKRATIVLDIKTGTAPGARNPRILAGQIRTKWALETGWVLRRWEIVGAENISMKYKDLPKPPDANTAPSESNQNKSESNNNSPDSNSNR